jgi:hypothetical protein
MEVAERPGGQLCKLLEGKERGKKKEKKEKKRKKKKKREREIPSLLMTHSHALFFSSLSLRGVCF